MCLSLEPYDVERLEQLCHFTSISVLVITWLPYLPLFSSFITQSIILPITHFLLANISVVVHSKEVSYPGSKKHRTEASKRVQEKNVI
jgi:hypothetical protein